MLTSSQISTTELRCYDHEMYGQVKLANVSISAEDLEVESSEYLEWYLGDQVVPSHGLPSRPVELSTIVSY